LALMTSGIAGDPDGEVSAPTRSRLLLVEDRGPSHDALVRTLQEEGYEVSTTGTISETLHQLRARRPDLALIDLMISDASGPAVYRRVSGKDPVPIIALAPIDAQAEVVEALQLGAVDYATRPLDDRALLGRIQIALTRFPRQKESQPQVVVAVGPITVELSRRQVSVRGVSVYLTKMEYEVLLALARRPGEILTRGELLDEVWAGRVLEDSSTLDVHIRRIRRKIELDPGHPELLVTARGVGYYLEDSGCS
jgi:two-component system, OmpR family, response regulator RegX3